jgi:hypothetical protein
MAIAYMLLTAIRAFCRHRSSLALENLALRQQLAVLRRSVKRPKLRRCDRLFWVLLKRYWDGWESRLILVKPETVICWHRQGFKAFPRANPLHNHSLRPSLPRLEGRPEAGGFKGF